jgi:hypothetical protein
MTEETRIELERIREWKEAAKPYRLRIYALMISRRVDWGAVYDRDLILTAARAAVQRVTNSHPAMLKEDP